ncbi:MAG TPA: aminoglycoside adenylyltransferase domain-containing protein [Ktedonobacterales bacterium]|nr:aminoglycoside adenylyltransferase domain-containing protein [Ktedonobacterales bacterium]
MATGPTPYARVNETLNLLRARLRAILGAKLVGLYLYGSLAAGDFDPASSDVDFVAATAAWRDDAELAALAAMHAEIAANGGTWGRRLEGAYFPLDALRRHNPQDMRHPFLSSTTPFGVHDLGWDWVINRHTLRERGVVVDGPPPATLIDPITREELTDAVRMLLRTDWARYLDDPELLRARNYQAFAIFTMCRALYALERGEFVSKSAAAAWADQHLDAEWRPLVERVPAWRADKAVDDAALPETLRFLRAVIERA